MLKAVLISLVAGALSTSTAEYLLHYNLVDYVKDFVVGLYQRVVGLLHKL